MRVVPVLRSIELPLEFFDLFFSVSRISGRTVKMSLLPGIQKKYRQNCKNVTSAGHSEKKPGRTDGQGVTTCVGIMRAHSVGPKHRKTPGRTSGVWVPYAWPRQRPHTRPKFAAATTERLAGVSLHWTSGRETGGRLSPPPAH